MWKVSGSKNLPVVESSNPWDFAAIRKRVMDWAGDDMTKYSKAFVVYDSSRPDLIESYKLPFADVVDGELVAVPIGIRAASMVLSESKSAKKIGKAYKESCELVQKYYSKLENAEKRDYSDSLSVRAYAESTPPPKRFNRAKAAKIAGGAILATAVTGLTVSAAARARAVDVLNQLRELSARKTQEVIDMIKMKLRPEQKLKEKPEVLEKFIRNLFEIKRATDASKTEAGSMFYSVFGNLYYRCFGDPVEDQAVITAKQAVEVLESGMNKMGKIEIKIGGQ